MGAGAGAGSGGGAGAAAGGGAPGAPPCPAGPAAAPQERGAKWGKRPRSLRRAGPKGGGGEAAAPEERVLRRRVEDLLAETQAAWTAPRRSHPKHASVGRWQPGPGGGLARVHQARGKAWRVVGLMADGAFGASAGAAAGEGAAGAPSSAGSVEPRPACPFPPEEAGPATVPSAGAAASAPGPGDGHGSGAGGAAAAGAGNGAGAGAGAKVPRDPGLLFLHPEEAAFLSEQCDLVLRAPDSDRVVSVRECYSLLRESGVGDDRYAAYSQLKRLAYIVKRHPSVWKAPRGEPPWLFAGVNWPDPGPEARAAAAAAAAGPGRGAGGAAPGASPAPPEPARRRGWFPALGPGHPWLGALDYASLPPQPPFPLFTELPPENPLRPFPALSPAGGAGGAEGGGRFDFDVHCPEGSTNFARRAPPPVSLRLRVEESSARPAFERDRWSALAPAGARPGDPRAVLAAVDGADICYFALGPEGVPWLS